MTEPASTPPQDSVPASATPAPDDDGTADQVVEQALRDGQLSLDSLLAETIEPQAGPDTPVAEEGDEVEVTDVEVEDVEAVHVEVEDVESADAEAAFEEAELTDAADVDHLRDEDEGDLVSVDPPVLLETDGPSVARRQARTAALETLFAADVRDQPPTVVMNQQPFVDDFTRHLVEMVVHYRLEIDALIEEWAKGWTLDRMPAVDRNVLRLGLAEMLYVEQVPPKVAIDEAVELAKNLSTDSSPRFVNGILAAVARERALV